MYQQYVNKGGENMFLLKFKENDCFNIFDLGQIYHILYNALSI